MRRERAERLDFSALGSRRGTPDEYRLLALIGAAADDDAERAAAAAATLEIANFRPLAALAADLARRLEHAGFELDLPDGRLLVFENGVVSEKEGGRCPPAVAAQRRPRLAEN